MFEVMLDLIEDAHKDQTDKVGFPYHLHCKRVACNSVSLLLEYGLDVDIDIVNAALGHDLTEDTYVTTSLLMNVKFSEACVDTITACDNGIHGRDKERYFRTLLHNYRAVVVKHGDSSDNARKWRLELLDDQKTVERLTRKYAKNLARLDEKFAEYVEEGVYRKVSEGSLGQQLIDAGFLALPADEGMSEDRFNFLRSNISEYICRQEEKNTFDALMWK